MTTEHTATPGLLACVGCYATNGPDSGGIHVFACSTDGRQLHEISHALQPQQAGYLAWSARHGVLYAVDERKTDGRGPVGAASAVHALALQEGRLQWLNSLPAPGPMPTYLCLDGAEDLLVCANHGEFAHVERVEQDADGQWRSTFAYDDSTVILYRLGTDGQLAQLLDLKVLGGHGKDPNASPQAGGHAQSGAHAHCAVFDPSGQFVLVCDKGTDRIYIYRVADGLQLVNLFQFEEEVAPRHLVFDAAGTRVFVTCELSSELAALDFDPDHGSLHLLARVKTTAPAHTGLNEPADLRLHPHGKLVYVNNRGEDSLAWFAVDGAGQLQRRGQVALAKSIHPGLAARSFSFSPDGSFLLVADRSAHLLRSYAVDAQSGALTPLGEATVRDPAYIAFIPPSP